MTSAPCSTPWLTSWTPCWTEPDMPAAFGGPHCRLLQRPPPPPAQKTPLPPKRGPSCCPQPAAFPTAAPCGAERTFQNLTSQQSPLTPAMCDLMGGPCFSDRDPGKSFLSRKSGGQASGVPSLSTPHPCFKCLCQGPLGCPPCSSGALRGWRWRCVWPGPGRCTQDVSRAGACSHHQRYPASLGPRLCLPSARQSCLRQCWWD